MIRVFFSSQMGLKCGTSVLLQGGWFPVLEPQQAFAPSNHHKCLYMVDVMCGLTGLQAPRLPWNWGDLDPDRIQYRPRLDFLLAGWFDHICQILRRNRDRDIVLGLVFDITQNVPSRKHLLQKQRSDLSRDLYELPEECCIRFDARGLIINERELVPARMAACMATRWMRPALFRYIRDFLVAQQWPTSENEVRILMDMEICTELPMKRGSASQRSSAIYTCNNGALQHDDDLQVGAYGEAEVSVLAWGLHFAATHEVHLASGDLDIIPLAWLNGHRFQHGLVTWIGHKYVCSYRRALDMSRELHDTDLRNIALGLMILGTDYIDKRQLCHGVGSNAALEAIRFLKRSDYAIEQDNGNLLGRTLHLVQTIVRRNKKEWADCKTPLSRDQLLQRYRNIRIPAKCLVTAIGFEQLQWNLNYWTDVVTNPPQPESSSHG